MGLPLAAVFAETTGNVVGADIDPDVVATVNDGACHVKREPQLPSLVDDDGFGRCADRNDESTGSSCARVDSRRHRADADHRRERTRPLDPRCRR